MLICKASREALTCYISSLKSISSVVVELKSSKLKLHVTCHTPIGILYTGMAEKRDALKFKTLISLQLLSNFYRTKTKLHVKASPIFVCGKKWRKRFKSLIFTCTGDIYQHEPVLSVISRTSY